MKRKHVLIVGCLPLLLFGAWMLAGVNQRWPDHYFTALDGITPISDETREYGWGMDGPIVSGHGARSDDDGPSLGRQIEFTFKADYEQIKNELEAEAVNMGSKPFTEPGGFLRTSEDVSVYISRGRFDPKTGNTYDDPGWVRVILLMSREEGRQAYVYRWIRNTLAR